ncbi:MAG: hypothetical protein LC795_03390 [Acidobacteria bacterium]|nr:hypothetical protein [Acidobacteriota bacterium]
MSSSNGDAQTTPASANAAVLIPSSDASTKPTSPSNAKPRHTPAHRRGQNGASRS